MRRAITMTKRTDHLRALLALVLAAAVAAGVLALVGTKPAEAAFPGESGKIAFSSNRVTATNPEGDYEIFTMTASGKKQKNRTKNDAANDIRPAWSPDGTKIAFQSDQDGNSESNSEIFTMNSNGTEQTNISDEADAKDNNGSPADDFDPDWQPIPPP